MSLFTKATLKITPSPSSIQTNNTFAKPQMNQSEEANESKNSFKHILKETLYNSLCQAIIKIIFSPHLIVKLFLILFVLVTSGLASYLAIESIMNYFTYGVTTTSRTVYEAPTLFPKVTFCNANKFTTKYSRKFFQNHSKYVLFAYVPNDERKAISHDLDDILVDCSFNREECNASDFTWSYDERYGNCYTFNSNFASDGSQVDLKKTSISGSDFGLQLSLYVNIYEELMEYVNNSGAIIRIGNSSYSTYYSNDGIFVPSGFSTYIRVKREFKSMLPKPYSHCEQDINLPKLKTNTDAYFLNLKGKFPYAYTQQLCLIECLDSISIEKFNCSLPFDLSHLDVKVCGPRIIDLIEKYFISNVAEIFQFCLPKCPFECNQTIYKTSLSFVSIIGNNIYRSIIRNNSNLALDFVSRTIDSAQAEKSFVNVYIYYESLSYTESSEMPQMNVGQLLASIGGNLGLFLGVSVFSLAEIVEVFIEIFYYVIN
jgi:hypothetical protein